VEGRKGGWPMIVMREVIGEELRRRRQDQGRTLREVSGAAAVSLGYLSEVERGHKEASSELLAAICDALDVSLSELLASVSTHLAQVELQHTAPTTRLPEMVLASAVGAGRPLS
jgi:transcriptional regulator with XRE-family HTH domain